MNKENIKIEPINNDFIASVEIPKMVIDLELNEYLNKVDEINKLIINDKNELYIRELLNRIDDAIEFIDIYTDGINLGAFDCLKLMYKVKEILKGSDQNEKI